MTDILSNSFASASPWRGWRLGRGWGGMEGEGEEGGRRREGREGGEGRNVGRGGREERRGRRGMGGGGDIECMGWLLWLPIGKYIVFMGKEQFKYRWVTTEVFFYYRNYESGSHENLTQQQVSQ